MGKGRRSVVAAGAGALALVTATAAAGQCPAPKSWTDEGLPTIDGSPLPGFVSLTAEAREQLEVVRHAVAPYASPADAREAGFRPRLGWFPTMGIHWPHPGRVGDGFELGEPDHLMFSPVHGERRLVGAAYAYRAEVGTPTPEAFDGNADVWHDHPRLARAGETLYMLHVWFVPSPGGPFAGHNPWLAYWAAGLDPCWPAPDSGTATSNGGGTVTERSRTLALAVGEAVRPSGLVRMARRFAPPGVEEELRLRRARLEELLGELRSAQAARDPAAWEEAADQAIAEWEAIRETIVEAAPTDRMRRRLQRALEHRLGEGQGAAHGHPPAATAPSPFR